MLYNLFISNSKKKKKKKKSSRVNGPWSRDRLDLLLFAIWGRGGNIQTGARGGLRMQGRVFVRVRFVGHTVYSVCRPGSTLGPRRQDARNVLLTQVDLVDNDRRIMRLKAFFRAPWVDTDVVGFCLHSIDSEPPSLVWFEEQVLVPVEPPAAVGNDVQLGRDRDSIVDRFMHCDDGREAQGGARGTSGT